MGALADAQTLSTLSGTGISSMAFFSPTPLGGFPFAFVVSWAIAIIVAASAVVISLRWLLGRATDRDPTPFAAVAVVQMLLFLLLNTVVGVWWMTRGVADGFFDGGFWYLCLEQRIGALLGNTLLCLSSLALVCLVSGRLPKLKGPTVLPVLLVVLDVTVLLMWATHVLTTKA